MDSYADMSDVENCFVEFMDKVPFYGAVTACIDDERLRGVLPRVRRRVYTYGESAEADFRLRLLPVDAPANPGPKIRTWGTQSGGEAHVGDAHARFEVNARGLVLGPFELHVPGRHNVLNATAAVAIGVQLG